MVFAIKIPFLVCFLLVLILSLQQSALSTSQVPCFFIFGDSLVDNGNNNQLNTTAKANYLPYGIDFPGGPTGRFTNGRNIADILAKLLGFDTYIPPLQWHKALTSAKGSHLALDQQLLNHNVTVSRITQLLGNNTTLAREHLSKCVYISVIGSNDYLNNYYMPDYYPTSRQYTPEQYATVLIEQYSQQLQRLYSYGARKIAVLGLPGLGCIPVALARFNSSSCVKPVDDAVELFNKKLEVLVKDLGNNFPDAKFVFSGATSILPPDLINLGIKFVRTPCCKVSDSTGQCIRGEAPCLLRALHAFYDGFHPSEVVNDVVATAVYLDILKLI